jgi:hypothetical protein
LTPGWLVYDAIGRLYLIAASEYYGKSGLPGCHGRGARGLPEQVRNIFDAEKVGFLYKY